MRGGPGGAVAIGFLGFAYLMISALVFAGSLIVLLILSIISLEIRRHQKDNDSA